MLLVGAGSGYAASLDHVYYFDRDEDSYGDPNNQVVVPVDWLAARSVTHRAGDPDDNDNAVFPATVPKGDRLFGLELRDSSESGGWPNALYRELAVDVATFDVRWSELESAPGEFQGPLSGALPVVRDRLPEEDLALSLTLSVINATELAVPEDLRALIDSGQVSISDSVVIDRFKALLDHVHGTIGDVPLVSLQFAREVDLMFPVRPDITFWVDFQVFYFSVAAHAKGLWGGDLKVGLTATHRGLIDVPQRWLMNYLNSTSDIIAMTYFPANADYTTPDPSVLDVEGTLASVIANSGSKPLHIQAAGYPSAAAAMASQMKQSQFLYNFFEAWDVHADSIPFVSFHRLHDADAAAVEERRETIGVGDSVAAVATDYLGSLGLRQRQGEGTHKTAYNSLRNLTFERGWWRDQTRWSRPYYMGFTPDLYDHPTDPDEVNEVESYLYLYLDALGDIVNVHMDGGIPWSDAYADDFSSEVPPYSWSLLVDWNAQLNRIPPDSKRLVSINPLGIPRSTLAAYWGNGEEFEYQQEAPWGRIPTGVVSDGAPRIPPAPWDTYSFDDPPVRTAFVNYARRVVQAFSPDYLLIGIEVSAAQVEDEEAWQAYLGMHKYVYAELKQLYPELPIMVSFSATSYMADELFPLMPDRSVQNGHTWKYDEMETGVRERLVQGFKDILPYTDIVAFSVYPHFGKYNAYQMPASMWDELFALLREAGAEGKPIAVAESGYTADPFSIEFAGESTDYLFLGTPEKQERFLKLMFYELNKSSHPVEFVINFSVRDGDVWWDRLTASGDSVFNQFYQYFRDIGIINGDGSNRPGTLVWWNEFNLPLEP